MTRTAAREATPTLSCLKSFLKASQHMFDTCNAKNPQLSTSQHTPAAPSDAQPGIRTLGLASFIRGARATMMLLWKLKCERASSSSHRQRMATSASPLYDSSATAWLRFLFFCFQSERGDENFEHPGGQRMQSPVATAAYL